MSDVEVLDVAAFRAKYEDNWWTPNYWEAVLESQRISVFGEEISVYGYSAARLGTWWSLCLAPDGDKRRR